MLVGLTKRRCSISLLSGSASSRSASKKSLVEASFGFFLNDFSAVLVSMNPQKTLNNFPVHNVIFLLVPCRSRAPRNGKKLARSGLPAASMTPIIES